MSTPFHAIYALASEIYRELWSKSIVILVYIFIHVEKTTRTTSII